MKEILHRYPDLFENHSILFDLVVANMDDWGAVAATLGPLVLEHGPKIASYL